MNIDDKIRRTIAAGITHDEVAAMFGVTLDEVRAALANAPDDEPEAAPSEPTIDPATRARVLALARVRTPEADVLRAVPGLTRDAYLQILRARDEAILEEQRRTRTRAPARDSEFTTERGHWDINRAGALYRRVGNGDMGT